LNKFDLIPFESQKLPKEDMSHGIVRCRTRLSKPIPKKKFPVWHMDLTYVCKQLWCMCGIIRQSKYTVCE